MSVLARTLDHIRGRVAQPADADLLSGFVRSRDAGAFAELVRRHGPLVRGVARRRLTDPHAADDVVQSTFLALARQANRLGRDRPLAGWLFTVAHRLAGKAQRQLARRPIPLPGTFAGPAADPLDVLTGRELLCALDDELARLPDRYRLPLVLCGLEGLSRDEAALRLGWTLGSVRGRLERGRELLRQRLAARGLTVPAVMAGGLLATPAEALPPAVVQAITRLALAAPLGGGPVRALALLLVVTAVGIGGGAGLWPEPQTATQDTKPSAPAQAYAGPADFIFAGRVLGPDGRPLGGARVFFSGLNASLDFKERTVSGADGGFRFTVRRSEIDESAMPRSRLPLGQFFAVGATADGCGAAGDWVRDADGWERLTVWLPAEEVVRGRVVDGDGKPVPGVRVRAVLRSGRVDANQKPLPYDATDGVKGQVIQFAPFDATRNEAMSDADGRVTLRGLSRDWLYNLSFSGPSVLTEMTRLVARPEPAVAPLFQPGQAPPFSYNSAFTHMTGRCKPITGSIREKGSGRALAGVTISRAFTGNSSDAQVSATSDKDGRYTLTGLPHGSHRLKVYPPKNTPYVTTEVIASTQQPGYEPAEVDIELQRQPAVLGRLTDQVTGKPVRGRVEYRPLAGNPELNANPALDQPRLGNNPPTAFTGADGRFTLPVLTGRGVLLARADTDYLPAQLPRADRAADLTLPADRELLDCRPFPAWPAQFHAVRLVDVPAGGTVEVPFALAPGVSRPLAVEYPDGRPSYTSVLGLHPTPVDHSERYFAGLSVIGGLASGERRRLILSTRDGKYAAAVEVSGDEAGPAVVRLKPTGTVTGRLVDDAGKPVAEAAFRLFFDGGPGRAGVFAHYATLLRDMTPAELSRARRTGPSAESFATRLSTSEHSGDDGRFTLSGLLPDVAFDLHALVTTPDATGRRLMSGEVIVARPTVKPGETLDLGDLRAVAPPK